MVDLAFFGNDLRVDQGEEAVLRIHRADIENDDSSRNSDLTGGQTNPPCLIHGLSHVMNQFPHSLINPAHCLRPLFQNGMRKFADF